MMKLLLSTGQFDVNFPDVRGRTPLSLAIGAGGGIVSFLLSLDGVDLNSEDCIGQTPFHWAACDSDVEAMIALLRTGEIDVNQPNNSGKTALSLAAGDKVPRRREVMRLLLSLEDIEVDSPDCDGRTPLLLAAANGDLKAVTRLITTGLVGHETLDYSGDSLFFLAVMSHRNGESILRPDLAKDRQEIYEMLQHRIYVLSDVSQLHKQRWIKWEVPEGLSLVAHLNVKAEPFEMPSMVYWIREIVYERVYKCLD
jgi:ankyrin repeat protein